MLVQRGGYEGNSVEVMRGMDTPELEQLLREAWRTGPVALCHLYAVTTKVVSPPAPVYYTQRPGGPRLTSYSRLHVDRGESQRSHLSVTRSQP